MTSSAVGAESNFLESVLGRLTASLKTADTEEEALHQTIANSFMVSSDMVSALSSILQRPAANLCIAFSGPCLPPKLPGKARN